MPRLMIISHGHPELSHGGAEVAAYAIHSKICKDVLAGWDSVFVARCDKARIGHDGEFGAFRGRGNEIIASPPDVDGFFFQSYDRNRLFHMLDALTQRFKPDVVHAHHFCYWGFDLIDYFANKCIPVVFTFHEYIAICNSFGQMLKTDGRLCQTSSPGECNACFPDISSGMFFLRNEIILGHLRRASELISPSAFLAHRIERWARNELSVSVIENPRDLDNYEAPRAEQPHADVGEVVQLGFFGQINRFKGIEVLLEALSLLSRRDVPVRLRLFGANLNMQEEAFRERIKAKLDALGDKVEFFGPYVNSAVLRLMSDCDAIVIPSIWWENSPVVIQEAIQAGVTIIGSRLGGIEEKLKNYPRAILFEVASPTDLAHKIEDFVRARRSSSPQASASERLAGEDDWQKLVTIYNAVLQKMESTNVSLEFRGATKKAKKSGGQRS